MFESRTQAPLSGFHFTKRVLWHIFLALSLLAASLGIGMLGYGYFEHFSLLDGFLNSAMLLGGMGPVNAPLTSGGKIFAGLYALYSGLVFIATAALIFTPIAHRLLHKFHWDAQ